MTIEERQLDPWAQFPLDARTGQRPNERDTPPQRTDDGDFILYHGSSVAGATSIIAEQRLRPDDLGVVGISTTISEARVFALMKRGPILRVVISADWLSRQLVKREIGGSGRNQFLISDERYMPVIVPLLSAEIIDKDD